MAVIVLLTACASRGPLSAKKADAHVSTAVRLDAIRRAQVEIERRLAAWTPRPPNYTTGVLAKYAALVGSASSGAVTTGPRMTANLAAARVPA